jgi:hypothetical protein
LCGCNRGGTLFVGDWKIISLNLFSRYETLETLSSFSFVCTDGGSRVG